MPQPYEQTEVELEEIKQRLKAWADSTRKVTAEQLNKNWHESQGQFRYLGTMNTLAEEIWQTCEEKGFHELPDAASLVIAKNNLIKIGSRLTEFEAYRKDKDPEYLGFHDFNRDQMENALRLLLVMTEVWEIFESTIKNPEKEGSEVADAIIRLLHYSRIRWIDIDKEVRNKMEINKGRPYKHGKRF